MQVTREFGYFFDIQHLKIIAEITNDNVIPGHNQIIRNVI